MELGIGVFDTSTYATNEFISIKILKHKSHNFYSLSNKKYY